MSVRRPTPEELPLLRAKWRAQKAKQRAKHRAHAGVICRMKLGPHAFCRGRIRERVDWLGRVTWSCERCERRRAGTCQTCPKPVYGKVGWALYCTACKRRASAAHNAKWVELNRERKNASVRAWRATQRAKRVAA